MIETAAARHLDGHVIHPIDIFIETDEDGVESFSIKPACAFSERPVDPAVTASLLMALSDALQNAGGRRFPCIDHDFDDRQRIKGWQLAS